MIESEIEVFKKISKKKVEWYDELNDVWWSVRGSELFLKNGGLRIKLEEKGLNNIN